MTLTSTTFIESLDPVDPNDDCLVHQHGRESSGLLITDHLRHHMRRVGITEAQVRAAVADPRWVAPVLHQPDPIDQQAPRYRFCGHGVGVVVESDTAIAVIHDDVSRGPRPHDYTRIRALPRNQRRLVDALRAMGTAQAAGTMADDPRTRRAAMIAWVRGYLPAGLVEHLSARRTWDAWCWTLDEIVLVTHWHHAAGDRDSRPVPLLAGLGTLLNGLEARLDDGAPPAPDIGVPAEGARLACLDDSCFDAAVTADARLGTVRPALRGPGLLDRWAASLDRIAVPGPAAGEDGRARADRLTLPVALDARRRQAARLLAADDDLGRAA